MDDRSTGADGWPTAPDPDGATIGSVDLVGDIGVIGRGPTIEGALVDAAVSIGQAALTVRVARVPPRISTNG